MTRDEAIEKAQKLLRLSKSDNANEAALAVQRYQEIVAKHQLDEALLSVDGVQSEPEEEIENFQKKSAPLNVGARRSTWKIRLASTIARANSCRIFTQGGHIHIIGRASDVSSVRYLFAYVGREANRLADRDGQGCGVVWRNNFRLGVIDAVEQKLRELKEKLRDEARAAVPANNGTALVRVNTALAKVEARDNSVALWEKTNMKYRKAASTKMSYDGTARSMGQTAGKEIQVGGARAALGSGAKMLGLR